MARDYTSDGAYWTVGKVGNVYWVVRIDNNKGDYRRAEIWGRYYRRSAAGGAAAELAYNQGKRAVAPAAGGKPARRARLGRPGSAAETGAGTAGCSKNCAPVTMRTRTMSRKIAPRPELWILA
ncbi:hypothetical protein [Micromonospora inaquosa]|uniref:hypothetical protein n=1 Tax=Micromonospora inaquosa TaxID=2203716 RepID=UPI000F5DA767|nr:hypothetical protein [Micromonospora inaquosa]